MFLKKESKGVTLIELLVSLNIIAFGIFIMAVVMIMLLKSGQTSIDNSSAYIVADSVMKQFLSDNKGDLNKLMQTSGTITDNQHVTSDEKTFEFSSKRFKYIIESTKVADTADMVYLKVTVREITTTDDAGNEEGGTKKNAIITTLVSPRTGIN